MCSGLIGFGRGLPAIFRDGHQGFHWRPTCASCGVAQDDVADGIDAGFRRSCIQEIGFGWNSRSALNFGALKADVCRARLAADCD